MSGCLSHKAKTHDVGLRAERAAIAMIKSQGGQILGHRVRNDQGEIDIISVNQGVIRFIEVKCRKTIFAALEAVSNSAWTRISRAAERFMAERPDLEQLDWCFDLIVQDKNGRIECHQDFWRPGW